MPTPTPALDLTDITLPRDDTSTVRAVLNGYMRGQVRAFAAFPVKWLKEPNRVLHQRTAQLVQQLLQSDPRRVVPVLRLPTHGALLDTALEHAHADGNHAGLNAWMRELCLLVLFELAMQGALPETGVTVEAHGLGWPRLRSIAANLLVTIDEGAASVTFRPGAVVARTPTGEAALDLRDALESGPFRIERPYHRIVDGVFLALSDNNPLSDFEAHPDKQGNTLDLGGRDVEEWVASLRGAFELVDRHLPLVGEELRLVLRLVVPVGYEPEKHLSASYKEVIGTVYLTLHPNLMTMTEALVHEFQHNKLNAALHLDPLLHNGFWPLYTSPVRPDPRPLHGVVLAVHAFQPVAKLYEAMTAADHPYAANPAWNRRFRDIIRMDRAGAQTVLSNAQPTVAGASFFDGMRALDADLGAYEAAEWTDAPAHAAPELPE